VILRRRAARAVLLDPDDRVLLLCSIDPTNPGRGRWWTTVGGGIEPSETPQEALRREVAEEVGIREIELGPLLWRRRSRFRFMGQEFEQDNDYFLARTSVTDIDMSCCEAAERVSTVESRWWVPADLLATSEVVYPHGLGALVVAMLREGPPAAALDLESDIEGGFEAAE
jgi:8-oxo-dGTP pyrophosphatase MutT (NUDIX family)